MRRGRNRKQSSKRSDRKESEHEGQGNGLTGQRRQWAQTERHLGMIDMVNLRSNRGPIEVTRLSFDSKARNPRAYTHICITQGHQKAHENFCRIGSLPHELSSRIFGFTADNFRTSSPVPARFRKKSRISVCKTSLLIFFYLFLPSLLAVIARPMCFAPSSLSVGSNAIFPTLAVSLLVSFIPGQCKGKLKKTCVLIWRAADRRCLFTETSASNDTK